MLLSFPLLILRLCDFEEGQGRLSSHNSLVTQPENAENFSFTFEIMGGHESPSDDQITRASTITKLSTSTSSSLEKKREGGLKPMAIWFVVLKMGWPSHTQ